MAGDWQPDSGSGHPGLLHSPGDSSQLQLLHTQGEAQVGSPLAGHRVETWLPMPLELVTWGKCQRKPTKPYDPGTKQSRAEKGLKALSERTASAIHMCTEIAHKG